MAMQAGKLRLVVTIQRQSGARDSTGNETLTWTTLAVVRAWIEPYIGSARAGREEFSTNQVVALDYTRIHLRWAQEIADLKPKDQVVYGTRVFDILAVNTRDERMAEIECIAKERQ